MSKILVTRRAGDIGSETCVERLLADHEVVVVDNISNSSSRSLEIVEKLIGRAVTFATKSL